MSRNEMVDDVRFGKNGIVTAVSGTKGTDTENVNVSSFIDDGKSKIDIAYELSSNSNAIVASFLGSFIKSKGGPLKISPNLVGTFQNYQKASQEWEKWRFQGSELPDDLSEDQKKSLSVSRRKMKWEAYEKFCVSMNLLANDLKNYSFKIPNLTDSEKTRIDLAIKHSKDSLEVIKKTEKAIINEDHSLSVIKHTAFDMKVVNEILKVVSLEACETFKKIGSEKGKIAATLIEKNLMNFQLIQVEKVKSGSPNLNVVTNPQKECLKNVLEIAWCSYFAMEIEAKYKDGAFAKEWASKKSGIENILKKMGEPAPQFMEMYKKHPNIISDYLERQVSEVIGFISSSSMQRGKRIVPEGIWQKEKTSGFEKERYSLSLNDGSTLVMDAKSGDITVVNNGIPIQKKPMGDNRIYDQTIEQKRQFEQKYGSSEPQYAGMRM